MAEKMTDAAESGGMEFLDGLSNALYVWGEVHKVWDRSRATTGEIKYYARLLVEDEPGTIQVNITDLRPDDIRYLNRHIRDNVLLRVRCFAMEGNAYYKALELITGAAVASSGGLASLLADDDG